MKLARGIHGAVLCAFFGLLACDADYVGESVPNDPPETRLTAFPPHLEATSTTVEFQWSGSDRDGRVVAFEWALAENGSDGCVDPEETASLQWQRTEDHSVVVRVPADEEIEPGLFAASYSFWVRAIDDDGDVDDSPESVAFTAQTLAPEISIVSPQPISSISCRVAPRTIRFEWKPSDADAQEGDVLRVRSIVLPWMRTEDLCYTQEQFETSNPIAALEADDPRWTEWVDYEAADEQTAIRIVEGLELDVGVLFAAQARDADGAVSTFFRWNREVRYFRPGAAVYPELALMDPTLGRIHGVGTTRRARMLFEGESLSFSWMASIVGDVGLLDGYRYGWNLEDPLDPADPNWATDWTAAAIAAPGRTLGVGEHSFTVAARGVDGETTTLTVDLTVVRLAPAAERRPLLLIDDTRQEPGQESYDLLQDETWANALAAASLTDFDALEAARESDRLTVETLANYRSVIWYSDPKALSFLHRDAAAAESAHGAKMLVERFQSTGGNVLLAGPGVASSTAILASPVLYSAMEPIVFDSKQDVYPCWDLCQYHGPAHSSSLSHHGFCVSMFERVRPPIPQLVGELTGQPPLRSLACDGLLLAEVGDAFVGQFTSLRPTTLRQRNDNQLYKSAEEAYDNFDVWSDRVTPIEIAGDCHEVMFTHSSRSAHPELVDVEACEPSERPVDGAACGLRVTTYTDRKSAPGSADYLWGFEVAGFEVEDVAAALRFVLTDWGLVGGS